MSQETEALERTIVFAEEVKAFLKGPIGQYLLDRSKEEVEAAVQQLKDVDPEDAKRIRQLQSVIHRNENVELWLGEIIQGAMDARNILAGEEP